MIAIIDDGVNYGCYNQIGGLGFDIYIDRNGQILPRRYYNKFKQSHGTTCAAVIKKYAPKAQIGSIKIISNLTMRGKISHLITALEWCEDNDIKIIHMSIGSKLVQDITPLKSVIDRLNERGCIIVAALANNMKFSAPASLDGVIGVMTDLSMIGDEFQVTPCGLYDVPFVSSSVHTLTDYQGEKHITPHCNSYAAPVITAKICSILNENLEFKLLQIANMLGLDAMPTYSSRLVNTSFTECDCDAPIIVISGSVKNNIWVITRISDLFTSMGYPSKVFSDAYELGGNEIELIPSNINPTTYMTYFVNRLELSGLFLITENEALIKNADARIFFSSRKNNNRYSGDDIFIPQNTHEGNIRNVVKQLIKLGNG